MSLIELFKSHVQNHWESHCHRNQMAEFLGGYYSGALGVHIYHDLKDCVKNDDEALYMWGKAMEHLHHDEKELYEEASGKAMQLTEPLLEDCKMLNKYNVVRAESDEWFTTFWSQENAMEQMFANIEEHPFKVWWNSLGAMAYWKIGIYYGMGYSYGRFWTRLMGHPSWNADLTKIQFVPPQEEVATNALL